MVDEVPTEQSETERLQENITKLREDRLNAAQSVQGDFLIEDEQVGIAKATRIKDKSGAELIVDSASAGLQDTAAFNIGEDIGVRATGVMLRAGEESDPTAKAMASEFLKLSERFDDPSWDPRNNQEQLQIIESDIEELGLDIEGPEAEALMSARSDFERQIIKDQVQANQQRMQNVSDAGALGLASYLAASILDIDTLTGVGLFAKLRKGKKVASLNRAVKAGRMTKAEAKLLEDTASRMDNLKAGAEAGATSAVVVEGTRALLDPTADEKDVIGATIMATTLGTGIGTVLPTRRMDDVAKDIAFSRVLDDAAKANPAVPERANFNSAMRFVEDAEGGFASVPGDRGGDTLFGITRNFYPEQYAEVTRLMETKGPRAARRYARNFYKGEFYNKVVTPDMNAAQATVVMDTAVNSGQETATRLFQEAGGDVNRFLDLREEFVRDIVRNDPSQEQFLDGWLNRIDNLRDEVAGVRPARPVQPSMDLDGSVGAASTGQPGEVFVNASAGAVQERAWQFFDDNPELDAAFTGLDEFVDVDATPLQKAVQATAERAYEGIKKTPFISDYDRLVRDAGVVGRFLAYHTLESPVGQIVNNRSAAATADLINRKAAVEYAPHASRHFDTWAKDKGIPRVSKKYVWDSHLEFGRELQLYRETIHAGGTPNPNTHKSIIAASEDLDRAYKTALDNNKKYGVEGFEDVEFISGYTPRKWRGEKFAKIESGAGIGSERVVQALKEGIMRMTPDMEEELAFIYATAIRRSARNSSMPSPVGSLMTTNSQGQAALEDAIRDLGLDRAAKKDAAEMARAILFKDSERGTVASSRRRINIDMTTPIEGTDNTLLDLIDNDIYALTDRTIRGQSNHAALASIGIQNRDKEAFIRAARDEAESVGADPEAAARAVDDVFSYFDEGAFAGGQGPISGRLNKLAILSFLPQLGITQMAEAGVAMGVGGLRGWMKYAGKSLPQMLKGKDPDLMDNLWGVNAYAADHRLWVSTDHLDDVDLTDSPHFMRVIDRAMDKGMRGMGYISGFYKVNEFLHSTAALTMNNYMVRSIRDGVNAKRLASMGVDDEFRAIIQNKLDSGLIEFDEQGFVRNMNVEQWDPEELDLLRIVTRRNMDQTVQKARKGEAHAWQYRELGSLFASLKSFTFTAAQKQLIKSARLADPEAFQMLLATTGTAGLAFAAKQIVNGNSDRLDDMDYLATGALNWSPLLSPMMMAVDPLSYAIGLDKVPGSPFPFNDWRYGSQGLLSMPAGITAFNQLANITRVPVDILDGGGLDRKSINALKAIPVIGRSYPMIPVMEMLEHDFGTSKPKSVVRTQPAQETNEEINLEDIE